MRRIDVASTDYPTTPEAIERFQLQARINHPRSSTKAIMTQNQSQTTPRHRPTCPAERSHAMMPNRVIAPLFRRLVDDAGRSYASVSGTDAMQRRLHRMLANTHGQVSVYFVDQLLTELQEYFLSTRTVGYGRTPSTKGDDQ
jgi:hypothetical protein